MFKNIIINVKSIIMPYITVLWYILMIFFLIIVASGSLALISTASTLNVVLGCCGFGMVVTYIVMYVKRNFLSEKEKK
jgi:hypothetical protein